MSDPLRLTLVEDPKPTPTRRGRPQGPEPGVALMIWIPGDRRLVYDRLCQLALRERASVSALALQFIEQAFRP